MRLFEHEAKALLADHGVATPGRPDEGAADGYVVKAQVLAKERRKHGGIEFADSSEAASERADEMRGTEVNGHPVEEVLVEERVPHDREYYVAFLYDTDHRSPVLLFSADGGSGVEDREVSVHPVDDGEEWQFRAILRREGVPSDELVGLGATLSRLYDCFRAEDARLLEVNPLARTDDGFVALDARGTLEDDAAFRRDRTYEARTVFGREKTDREAAAEAIDAGDHRGVAGKYVELDGDIAMMLAGGGASLTNMDALLAYGGDPANYTEYGGNPPSEKVYELTKVILSKPGLRGCWHVGGTANNTDVRRTMRGFCRGLREVEPDFPIVVRRDGPNADAGFELLRETRDELGLEMRLFRNDTPMSKTAETLVEMVG